MDTAYQSDARMNIPVNQVNHAFSVLDEWK